MQHERLVWNTRPLFSLGDRCARWCWGCFCRCTEPFSLRHHIHAIGRDPYWASSLDPRINVHRHQADITDEEGLLAIARQIQEEEIPLRFAINCSGLLHDGELQPERTWRHLDLNTMRRVFDVNTFGVALFIKHILPVMPRRGRSILASLSARVGSIKDNQIGGWYSYRASERLKD